MKEYNLYYSFHKQATEESKYICGYEMHTYNAWTLTFLWTVLEFVYVYTTIGDFHPISNQFASERPFITITL